MNLLAIDTSTDYCSVAASRGETIGFRHERAGQRQAERVLGMVDIVLAEAGLALADISGIAYGAGPGSFTGLRVACGVTQGLALARGIPVVGIGTLLALAEEAAEQAAEEATEKSACGRVIACIDARMGEVYHAAYRKTAAGWEEIVPPGLYRPEAVPAVPGEGWSGCGGGFAAYGGAVAARYRGQLTALRPEVAPSARAVLRLALPRFAAGDTCDPATAIPLYLRDKVALKTSERA
ncbi:MAG: tRNA (adenosine(37)-N6)-threonylcarbamoyltransferase complex dimerization subunit type 1 TsaB [Burkholderiales bacterium]